MPPRPRVTIAMQFEGHVAPTALASYTRLVHRAERDGLLGTITFCEGGVVDGARNRLVGQALQNDPAMTHLLWVDPNVVVPEDAVGRLLAGGHQVCGAVTPRRDAPQLPKRTTSSRSAGWVARRRRRGGWGTGARLHDGRGRGVPRDGRRVLATKRGTSVSTGAARTPSSSSAAGQSTSRYGSTPP